MIIRDDFNNPLRLAKTRLSEVEPNGYAYWSVDLIALNMTSKYTETVRIIERRSGATTGFTLTVEYVPRVRRIGCRVFDRKNWALIRAAVKAAKETQ